MKPHILWTILYFGVVCVIARIGMNYENYAFYFANILQFSGFVLVALFFYMIATKQKEKKSKFDLLHKIFLWCLIVFSGAICAVSLFIFVSTILQNNTMLDFTFLMILVSIFGLGGVIYKKSQDFKFKKVAEL
ncbi:hypothetical protein JJB27_08965 [Campylobacter fetus subsp. venerealis]|uniref:hypothetical protein n=1 Tax=Campylobacter fetus TaxID=196 RepID=UPI00190B90EB|nr:hypothetical protein [Campylobacter fetus]MBK3499194.1 hypothetical protein [Campylobacter fetus subsp. venerealis]MBK3503153.1 hypothetical protein [Campylobacter fetus subsp. venerealis]HDX6244493.1 hypothetical protein [Campylobacter fetus subsp. venerealis]HDX6324063.1 hypothetical protein [Campylobacter fetus subsp. venerealis]